MPVGYTEAAAEICGGGKKKITALFMIQIPTDALGKGSQHLQFTKPVPCTRKMKVAGVANVFLIVLVIPTEWIKTYREEYLVDREGMASPNMDEKQGFSMNYLAPNMPS